MFQSLGGIAGSFSKVINSQIHIKNLKQAVDRKDTAIVHNYNFVDGKSMNDIELKTVSFKYRNSESWLFEDLELEIKENTHTVITGQNGSGKSTLFNLIAGNLKSSSGSVYFNSENITDIPSYELFSKGLLRTFQIAHEFTNLSVLENLMMVPGNQSGEKLMNALLKPRLVAKEESQIKEKAIEVVDFLNLSHLKNELAGNLSGGQKNY